jgi:hypothetical protein
VDRRAQTFNNASWYNDWWGNVTNIEKCLQSPEGQFAVRANGSAPAKNFGSVYWVSSTEPGIVVYHPGDRRKCLY